MISAREILAGTQLQDRYLYLQEDASVNEGIGFLTLQAPFSIPRQEMLVGFGVPGWQLGTDELPESVQSVTEFDDLPGSQRTLSKLNMGVGVRLHNTWQGATAMPEDFQRIGVYMLGFAPGNVHSMVKMDERGQQFDRIVQSSVSRVLGLKSVVRTVHWWQETVDLSVHAHPRLGVSTEHRQPPLDGLDEQVVVVRNSAILLTKVGEVAIGDGLH